MKKITWMYYLSRMELMIGEPIIAITITDEPYFDYEDDKIYNTYLEENFSGINNVTNTDIKRLLNLEFDADYGAAEGAPFTAWTDNYVLVPKEYDGAESIIYVPRYVCNTATKHV